jgi:hypothetical protein
VDNIPDIVCLNSLVSNPRIFAVDQFPFSSVALLSASALHAVTCFRYAASELKPSGINAVWAPATLLPDAAKRDRWMRSQWASTFSFMVVASPSERGELSSAVGVSRIASFSNAHPDTTTIVSVTHATTPAMLSSLGLARFISLSSPQLPLKNFHKLIWNVATSKVCGVSQRRNRVQRLFFYIENI